MYHSRCLYTALPICCCPEGNTAAPTVVGSGPCAVDGTTSGGAVATAVGVPAARGSTSISGVAEIGFSLPAVRSSIYTETRLFHGNGVQAGWRNTPALRDATASVVIDFLSVGREVSRQRRRYLRLLKEKVKQKEYCMLCELNEVDPAYFPSTVCGKCRHTKHLRRSVQQQQQEVAQLSATLEDEEEEQQEHRRQQQQQPYKRKYGVSLPVGSSGGLPDTERVPHRYGTAAAVYGSNASARSAPTRGSVLLTALLSACSPASGGNMEGVSPTATNKDSRAAAASSSRTAGRALQEKQRRMRCGDYLPVQHLQNGGRGKERQEEKRDRAAQICCCQLRRCKRKSDPSDMLTCCTCGLTTHASCCDPPLRFEAVTRFPWQCPDCKLCIVCEYNVSEETMLICDSCDRAYHMECLKPPVLEIPEGKWFCADCWRCCSSCGKELSQDDTWDEAGAAVDGEPMCRACAKATSTRSKRSRGLSNTSGDGLHPSSTNTGRPSSSTDSSRYAGISQEKQSNSSSSSSASSSYSSLTENSNGGHSSCSSGQTNSSSANRDAKATSSVEQKSQEQRHQQAFERQQPSERQEQQPFDRKRQQANGTPREQQPREQPPHTPELHTDKQN